LKSNRPSGIKAPYIVFNLILLKPFQEYRKIYAVFFFYPESRERDIISIYPIADRGLGEVGIFSELRDGI